MADIQKSTVAPVHNKEMADAAPAPERPPTIFRKDYREPDWLIPSAELDFRLGLSSTRVEAKLSLARNGDHDRPLRLDFEDNEPVAMTLDGRPVNWRVEGDQIVIDEASDGATLTLECEIHPDRNTRLEGLYASNGMLCTQCEAEGFRAIVPFVDRPDNLTVFTVTLHGDMADFPVLLSNGDLVEQAEQGGGLHMARWRDPWPKPSYLFALVAGDLVANRDSFTTRSGRKVDLAIYVREGDLERTGHAMTALKNSMKWDEERYGREYDLDLFNIVAVSDFNMGAMENKGLNIFNTRYILADPELATDTDYDGIEGVVAHEYFHNWSGNRVTCRDWFQLSLKEGFTVFRDQQFSAEMGSEAVKRIDDVRVLRAAQFPEDAGPLAHSVRPDSYMEISNFYTATVYNKGAEVIRMMHTLMGPDRFRSGTDLYFDRHDGEAATCEDFVVAMEDGGDIDLRQFRKWYSTPGTPRVRMGVRHDAESGILTLDFSQAVAPGSGAPMPSDLVIPLKTALLDPETGKHEGEKLLVLDAAEKSFEFPGYSQPPVVSVNRGFSAPIVLETERGAEDLAFLSANDDDEFARYEAMQQLMVDHLIGRIGGDGEAVDPGLIVGAVGRILDDEDIDKALLAAIVTLPSEGFLGEQMLLIDPAAIHDARNELKTALAKELQDKWRRHFEECRAIPFSLSAEARAARKMLGVALSYLAAAAPEEGAELAWELYRAADNMTVRIAALAVLANGDSAHREAALADFHDRFGQHPLVLDKWFTIQSMSEREDTIDAVERLASHEDFTLSNPNRVRALYMGLSSNQLRFHDASGRGYRMIADLIIALDKTNPQTAARFVPALGRWRRFEPGRSEMMRAELERIGASGDLSRDVGEQVGKSLG